jgi:N-acylglucosamine-6-phosphate 2-epimerase
MNKRKQALLESLQGGLIVSCQVAPEDPVYIEGSAEKFVAAMAKAAAWAGAVGIRANTPEQIREIKRHVNLPVIGLYKIITPGSEVFITPTLEAAIQIHEAGADIIALDCTARFVNGRYAYELLPQIKRKIPDVITFADIATFDEAANAVALGADIVAPTLYGYTSETNHTTEPDINELIRMIRAFDGKAYVFMEGRVNTPDDAVKYLQAGVHAVVVGNAITRPHLIAKQFADKIRTNFACFVENPQ